MSLDPRPRHRQGHGPDPAPLLPAQGRRTCTRRCRPTSRRSSGAACSSSTTSGARSSARPASSAPRPARSSASTWAGSTPRAAITSTGARPRRTASGARNRPSAGPAGPCPTRPTSTSSADRPAAGRRDPRRARPRPEGDARDPRGDPGRLRLPAGRRAQADQLGTGAWYAMVYGTATYYRHLRFEPPAAGVGARRAGGGRRPDAARSDGGYLAGLDLVAGGPPRRRSAPGGPMKRGPSR